MYLTVHYSNMLRSGLRLNGSSLLPAFIMALMPCTIAEMSNMCTAMHCHLAQVCWLS